jgi:hypothetical protein
MSTLQFHAGGDRGQ